MKITEKRLKFKHGEGNIYKKIIDTICHENSHKNPEHFALMIMEDVQNYGEKRFKSGQTFANRRCSD